MKAKLKNTKKPAANAARLKKLAALNKRLCGTFKDFMTLEDLMKMREMDMPKDIGHVPPQAP